MKACAAALGENLEFFLVLYTYERKDDRELTGEGAGAKMVINTKVQLFDRAEIVGC